MLYLTTLHEKLKSQPITSATIPNLNGENVKVVSEKITSRRDKEMTHRVYEITQQSNNQQSNKRIISEFMDANRSFEYWGVFEHLTLEDIAKVQAYRREHNEEIIPEEFTGKPYSQISFLEPVAPYNRSVIFSPPREKEETDVLSKQRAVNNQGTSNNGSIFQRKYGVPAPSAQDRITGLPVGQQREGQEKSSR